MRNKNKKDNCLQCNKEFKHYSWDNQKYCSKECHYLKLKIKCNCITCGKEILKNKYNFNKNNKNYCNKECYNNRRKENLKKLKLLNISKNKLFY